VACQQCQYKDSCECFDLLHHPQDQPHIKDLQREL